MISKEIASQVLSKCLITGGDFAEIFEEDTISNNISLIDKKVESAELKREKKSKNGLFYIFSAIFA